MVEGNEFIIRFIIHLIDSIIISIVISYIIFYIKNKDNIQADLNLSSQIQKLEFRIYQLEILTKCCEKRQKKAWLDYLKHISKKEKK